VIFQSYGIFPHRLVNFRRRSVVDGVVSFHNLLFIDGEDVENVKRRLVHFASFFFGHHHDQRIRGIGAAFGMLLQSISFGITELHLDNINN